MARFDGSLARTLDFGDAAPAAAGGTQLTGHPVATGATAQPHARGSSPTSRTAKPVAGAGTALDVLRRPGLWTGAPRLSDKYRALEHRRRQAQMKARRMLAVLD
jgi:hypothetical protein